MRKSDADQRGPVPSRERTRTPEGSTPDAAANEQPLPVAETVRHTVATVDVRPAQQRAESGRAGEPYDVDKIVENIHRAILAGLRVRQQEDKANE